MAFKKDVEGESGSLLSHEVLVHAVFVDATHGVSLEPPGGIVGE